MPKILKRLLFCLIGIIGFPISLILCLIQVPILFLIWIFTGKDLDWYDTHPVLILSDWFDSRMEKLDIDGKDEETEESFERNTTIGSIDTFI